MDGMVIIGQSDGGHAACPAVVVGRGLAVTQMPNTDEYGNIGYSIAHVATERLLGMEAVFRMSFLGGSERMSAERAYQLGLVGDVVPAAQLGNRALELASEIAQHSPAALVASKRVIWESLNRGLGDSLAHAWDIISEHAVHPDSREGPAAFAERREPRWQPFGRGKS